MTKLNVAIVLAGSVVAVKEQDDKYEVKSRTGKEVGQSKFKEELSVVGLSWDEWTKRKDLAIAALTTGKAGKASKSDSDLQKRIDDNEQQITDLTEKLDVCADELRQANEALEEAQTEIAELKASTSVE